MRADTAFASGSGAPSSSFGAAQAAPTRAEAVRLLEDVLSAALLGSGPGRGAGTGLAAAAAAASTSASASAVEQLRPLLLQQAQRSRDRGVPPLPGVAAGPASGLAAPALWQRDQRGPDLVPEPDVGVRADDAAAATVMQVLRLAAAGRLPSGPAASERSQPRAHLERQQQQQQQTEQQRPNAQHAPSGQSPPPQLQTSRQDAGYPPPAFEAPQSQPYTRSTPAPRLHAVGPHVRGVLPQGHPPGGTWDPSAAGSLHSALQRVGDPGRECGPAGGAPAGGRVSDCVLDLAPRGDGVDGSGGLARVLQLAAAAALAAAGGKAGACAGRELYPLQELPPRGRQGREPQASLQAGPPGQPRGQLPVQAPQQCVPQAGARTASDPTSCWTVQPKHAAPSLEPSTQVRTPHLVVVAQQPQGQLQRQQPVPPRQQQPQQQERRFRQPHMTAALLVPPAVVTGAIPGVQPATQVPVVLTIDDGRGSDGGSVGGSADDGPRGRQQQHVGVLVVQQNCSGVIADPHIAQAISRYQGWVTAGWRVQMLGNLSGLGPVYWVEWRVAQRPMPPPSVPESTESTPGGKATALSQFAGTSDGSRQQLGARHSDLGGDLLLPPGGAGANDAGAVEEPEGAEEEEEVLRRALEALARQQEALQQQLAAMHSRRAVQSLREGQQVATSAPSLPQPQSLLRAPQGLDPARLQPPQELQVVPLMGERVRPRSTSRASEPREEENKEGLQAPMAKRTCVQGYDGRAQAAPPKWPGASAADTSLRASQAAALGLRGNDIHALVAAAAAAAAAAGPSAGGLPLSLLALAGTAPDALRGAVAASAAADLPTRSNIDAVEAGAPSRRHQAAFARTQDLAGRSSPVHGSAEPGVRQRSTAPLSLPLRGAAHGVGNPQEQPPPPLQPQQRVLLPSGGGSGDIERAVATALAVARSCIGGATRLPYGSEARSDGNASNRQASASAAAAAQASTVMVAAEVQHASQSDPAVPLLLPPCDSGHSREKLSAASGAAEAPPGPGTATDTAEPSPLPVLLQQEQQHPGPQQSAAASLHTLPATLPEQQQQQQQQQLQTPPPLPLPPPAVPQADPVIGRSAPRPMSRYLTSGEIRILFTERDSRVLCNPPCGLMLTLQIFQDGLPLGPAQDAQLCRYNGSSPRYLTSVPAQEATSPPLPWKRLADTTIQYRRCRSGVLQLWATSPRGSAAAAAAASSPAGGRGREDPVMQLTTKAAAAMPKLVAFKPPGLRRAAWLASSVTVTAAAGGGGAGAGGGSAAATPGDTETTGAEECASPGVSFRAPQAAGSDAEAPEAKASPRVGAEEVVAGGSGGSVDAKTATAVASDGGVAAAAPPLSPAAAEAAGLSPVRGGTGLLGGGREARQARRTQALLMATGLLPGHKSDVDCEGGANGGGVAAGAPQEPPLQLHQGGEMAVRSSRPDVQDEAAPPGAGVTVKTEARDDHAAAGPEPIAATASASASALAPPAPALSGPGTSAAEQVAQACDLASAQGGGTNSNANASSDPNVPPGQLWSARVVAACPPRSLSRYMTKAELEVLVGPEVYSRLCEGSKLSGVRVMFEVDGRRMPEVFVADIERYNSSSPFYLKAASGRGADGLPWRAVPANATVQWRRMADDTLVLAAQVPGAAASDAPSTPGGPLGADPRVTCGGKRETCGRGGRGRSRAGEVEESDTDFEYQVSDEYGSDDWWDSGSRRDRKRRRQRRLSSGGSDDEGSSEGLQDGPSGSSACLLDALAGAAAAAAAGMMMERKDGRTEGTAGPVELARTSAGSCATAALVPASSEDELAPPPPPPPPPPPSPFSRTPHLHLPLASASAATGTGTPAAAGTFTSGLGVLVRPSPPTTNGAAVAAAAAASAGGSSFISRVVATNLYIGRRQLQSLYGPGFAAETRSEMQLSLNGTLLPEVYFVQWKEGCHKGSFYPKGAPLGQLRGRFLQGLYWLDAARTRLLAVAWDQAPADWPVRRRRVPPITVGPPSGAQGAGDGAGGILDAKSHHSQVTPAAATPEPAAGRAMSEEAVAAAMLLPSTGVAADAMDGVGSSVDGASGSRVPAVASLLQPVAATCGAGAAAAAPQGDNPGTGEAGLQRKARREEAEQSRGGSSAVVPQGQHQESSCHPGSEGHQSERQTRSGLGLVATVLTGSVPMEVQVDSGLPLAPPLGDPARSYAEKGPADGAAAAAAAGASAEYKGPQQGAHLYCQPRPSSESVGAVRGMLPAIIAAGPACADGDTAYTVGTLAPEPEVQEEQQQQQHQQGCSRCVSDEGGTRAPRCQSAEGPQSPVDSGSSGATRGTMAAAAAGHLSGEQLGKNETAAAVAPLAATGCPSAAPKTGGSRFFLPSASANGRSGPGDAQARGSEARLQQLARLHQLPSLLLGPVSVPTAAATISVAPAASAAGTFRLTAGVASLPPVPVVPANRCRSQRQSPRAQAGMVDTEALAGVARPSIAMIGTKRSGSQLSGSEPVQYEDACATETNIADGALPNKRPRRDDCSAARDGSAAALPVSRHLPDGRRGGGGARQGSVEYEDEARAVGHLTVLRNQHGPSQTPAQPYPLPEPHEQEQEQDEQLQEQPRLLLQQQRQQDPHQHPYLRKALSPAAVNAFFAALQHQQRDQEQRLSEMRQMVQPFLRPQQQPQQLPTTATAMGRHPQQPHAQPYQRQVGQSSQSNSQGVPLCFRTQPSSHVPAAAGPAAAYGPAMYEDVPCYGATDGFGAAAPAAARGAGYALLPAAAAAAATAHETSGAGVDDGGDYGSGADADVGAGAADDDDGDDNVEATEELVIRTMPWISMPLAQRWYPEAALGSGQAPHPVTVAIEADGVLQPDRYPAHLKSYPFNNSVFLPGLPVKQVKGMIRTGWRKLRDGTLVLMVRSPTQPRELNTDSRRL